MYSRNRIGPRTDPCDTPCRTTGDGELNPEHAGAGHAGTMRTSLSQPHEVRRILCNRRRKNVMIDTVEGCSEVEKHCQVTQIQRYFGKKFKYCRIRRI